MTARRAIGVLAAGVATAVVVAWACVYGPRSRRPVIAGLDTGARAAWLARAPAGIDVPFDGSVMRLTERGPGVDTVDIATYRTDDPFVESGHVMTIRSGWPLRCLHGERWSARDESGAQRVRARGLWNAPLRRRATVSGAPTTLVTSLPLRPLWTGLAANALLYGGAWWGVVAILSAFVRRRRSRRAGHCPACGYDLTGSPSTRCPECGRTTRGRSTARSTRP